MLNYYTRSHGGVKRTFSDAIAHVRKFLLFCLTYKVCSLTPSQRGLCNIIIAPFCHSLGLQDPIPKRHMMSVDTPTSSDEFSKLLENAGSSLVVVHFSADWAPQCKQMNDVLIELSKDDELKLVRFVQVEAESLAEVSQEHGISAVPAFVFFRNKKPVFRLNGANVPELAKAVRSEAAASGTVVTSVPAHVPAAEDLNSHLKKLINAAPCMLFMKGTPQEPKCGFSRQIVAILDSKNAEYSTFNILSDEKVRQGLKEFSNWPTYPQVYVNGELIGGLDIVKEMNESGELEQILIKKCSLDERLKGLINKAPVMLFMKGNPTTPRCGFSKQVISILNETEVPYESFDILEDEEVRQGLKTFSNWPTYPQLYVKGELVGGFDIIKELKETGELLDVINPKA